MRSEEKKGCSRKMGLWKRGLSLLLVLAMVMGGQVAYAAESGMPQEPPVSPAEETQEEGSGAVLFDSDPGTEEDYGVIEEIAYVNPLYVDVVKPSELDRNENDGIALFAAYEQCSSMKQAAELVRKRMKERTGTFTFQMSFKGTAPGNFLTTVLDQAMAHTGKPTEGDYLRWQYGGVRLSGSYYSTGNNNYLYTWTFTVTYYTTKKQEDEMNTLVKKTLASLNLGKASEHAKVEGIYKYICTTVKYDYANLNNTSHKLKFTAYAALKNKTAVCQGYALLFYRLALELGVDARFISGLGNGGAHGWNIVRINGRYYNLDSTWDAEYYRVLKRYEYFLKSNNNFTDHVRDSVYRTSSFNNIYVMSSQNYTAPKSISKATVTLGTTSYTYNGSAKRPSVTVKLSGTTLKKNTDYTISYSNNINIGTATVTIKGTGRYTGTVKKTFKIIVKKGGSYTVGSLKYRILNASTNGKGTVSVTGTMSKTLTSLNLGSVKIGGVTFKVAEIDANAFKGKTTLKTVKMGSSITSIGASAFQGCTKLTTLTIGSSVKTIGNNAFYKCTALTKAVIPSRVTTIGSSAFYGCTKLASLTVGSGVTSIGSSAFYSCKALKNITISTTKLTSSKVGKNAFKGIYAKAKIKVPSSKRSSYKTILKARGVSSGASIS